MLTGILILWFVLTFASLVFIIYDLLLVTPASWVMKIAWVLVVLYTGPIGLFIYLLSCREHIPDTHDKFIAAQWKQSVGSEVHCLAGDATGIIIAAVIISFFTVSPGMEAFFEYIAGFTVGLFIFQALFMKDMMGGSYFSALKQTFFPEWLSMNMIMAGMIPTIMIWRHFDPSAANPATLSFWGSMSLASIIGGMLAYPVNKWLVVNGLKHGMMSGGTSHATNNTQHGGTHHMQHNEHEHKHGQEHDAEKYEDIVTSSHHDEMHQPNSGMHQGLRGELHKNEMEMKPKVTKAKLFWMTVLTLVVLGIGIIIGMYAAKA